MTDLTTIKSHLRDINLELLTNTPDFEIDISKRYNTKFRLFYPSRKLIKYVTKIGGVLTGSRALRCYKIDGKPILDRKVNDWDFIVTLDMAFKICDDMKLGRIPSLGDTISIKNQRRWIHPDYSESYRLGPVDVQLIIQKELPEYKEIGGIRITDFSYSISQKLSLATDLYTKIVTTNTEREEYSKHLSDLTEMVIKFNTLTCKEQIS